MSRQDRARKRRAFHIWRKARAKAKLARRPSKARRS